MSLLDMVKVYKKYISEIPSTNARLTYRAVANTGSNDHSKNSYI